MQVIEAIELKEGTELQVFAKKGISVCIVGHGCISGLLARELPEAEIIDTAEVLSAGYDGEMKLDLSENDLKRLKEAYSEYCNKRQSVIEFTIENLSLAMDSLKLALLNCNRISNHPRFMQHERVNYRKPILRPAIIRKGSRQSKREAP
jgi:hypothetical protein